MQKRQPPFIATWLISHWGDKYRRDALVGDLMEEYQRGRSDAWYWMQVVLALRASAALCRIVLWWCVLFVVGYETKSVMPLFLALDPGIYRLIFGRRRKSV
jgi:hypothetical protein